MSDPLEFYYLLQRLKSGSMIFEDFLKKAKKWAQRLPEKPVRPSH